MKSADTNLVPAQGSNNCHAELEHIQSWTKENNLSLDCAKSKEIVFRARGVRGATTQLSSPTDCIERMHKVAPGVVDNNQLTSTDHIRSLLASRSSLLYALRVLRHHSLPSSSLLHDVSRATVMAKNPVLLTCMVRFQLGCRP